jgi:hypothetical protein
MLKPALRPSPKIVSSSTSNKRIENRPFFVVISGDLKLCVGVVALQGRAQLIIM